MGLRVFPMVFFVSYLLLVPRPEEGGKYSCAFTHNALSGGPPSCQISVKVPPESVTEDTCLGSEYGLLESSMYWTACAKHSAKVRARNSTRNLQHFKATDSNQVASDHNLIAETDIFDERSFTDYRCARIDPIFHVLKISRNATHTRILIQKMISLRFLFVEFNHLALAALVQHQIPTHHKNRTAFRLNTTECDSVVSLFSSSNKRLTDIIHVALRFPSLVVLTTIIALADSSRNITILRCKHGVSEGTNQSSNVLEMPDDKDYPCPCQLFVANKLSDGPFHDQSHTTPGMQTPRWMTIAGWLSTILVACLYTLHLRYDRKDVDSTIVLPFFTKSFSLKWHWTLPQDRDALSKPCHGTKGHDELNFFNSPFRRKKSLFGALNDYIFRPWLLKPSPGRPTHCPSPSRTNGFCSASSDSALCSSCRAHLDNFRRMGPRAIQVTPVTRFLPDATRNPDIDLVHVGYRLATLSALPPSVPVSRVRLADAGFYFRGQGDEVTCYSCRAQHSGWTGGDAPMEVHRRLSPQCEHVMRRDREQFAAASLGAGVGGAGGPDSRAHPGFPPVSGASLAANSHVEDGDGSQETPPLHPPASAPPPRETAPSQQGVVSTGTGALRSTGTTTTRAGARPDRNSTSRPSPGASSTSGARTSSSTSSRGATADASSRAVADSRPPTTVSRPSDAASDSGVTQNNSSSSSSSRNSSRSAEARPLFPRAGLDLGGAVYPMYQDMATRRRTFGAWDDSRAPPLELVILCGMFYAGEWALPSSSFFYLTSVHTMVIGYWTDLKINQNTQEVKKNAN